MRNISASFFLLLWCAAAVCSESDSAGGTLDKYATRRRPIAIIVGASSGMGRELAKILAVDYDLGLIARRISRLEALQQEIAQTDPDCTTWVKQLDVSNPRAMEQLANFIDEIGGLDLMVISITSYPDSHGKTPLTAERLTLEVELLGFWKMAYIAAAVFRRQKSGHLVGISSIDALRGNPSCPVYSAAKAFVSRYLEGVRNRFHAQGLDKISVTDVLPGYVQTEGFDASSVKEAYWIASARDASLQIYDAIKTKQKVAYITRRWQLIAVLMHYLPDWVFYDLIGGL